MAESPPFVLLLNPPYVDEVYDFKQDFSVEYPLGLAYLAGTLERDGIDYDILDANARGFSFDSTVDAALEKRPRLLGVTSTTTTVVLAGRIADECKRRDPSLVLVLGGAHGNAIPAETLADFPSFDYVVQGDGEIVLAELCHTLRAGLRVEDDRERWEPVTTHGGLWFRNERGEPLHFAPRRAFGHLNDIPFPSRRKLENELYNIGPLMNAGYRGIELTKLAGSRGCPYACNFCSEGMEWPPYRARTPENIFKEIETCYHRDGARHFYFVDDTINVRTKDLFRLCSMIKESGMKIRWHCHARVRPITDEILTAMRESGCFGLMFGVESGDPVIIRGLGKNISTDHVRSAVALAKKHEFKVLTFFMFGHIGDTPETCQRTIDFACEITPDLAFFSMATPYPGTELYQHYLANGALPEGFSWDDFRPHKKNAMHHTPTMTGEEIWRFYNKAHRAFYLRPRYVGRALHRMMQAPREVSDYWWLVREFLQSHEWLPSPINPGSSARA